MYIQSQEQAINSIVHSAAAWEFSRLSHSNHPLIWAFTGPTGVGKSETAYRITETVLGRKGHASYNRRSLPTGLLVLRGEDYSVSSLNSHSTSTSTSTSTKSNFDTLSQSKDIGSVGIAELRSLLAQRVIFHVRYCGGNAIIIIEEIQKVAPGVLEVLVPALEKNGELRWKDAVVSTSNCIFIFISDIGADVMMKLLLGHGGDRLSVPVGSLRREVKLALNQQWDRLGMGKNIDEIVPFLPLERIHLFEIFTAKLVHLSIENQFIYWLELVVDPAVVHHLIGPDYIAYTQFSATSSTSTSSASASTSNSTTVDDDSDITTESNPSPNSNSKCKITTKVYSTWGARALENGGPLEDLRGLLFRFMQPWRPRQILHIGLADDRTASSLFPAHSSMHSHSHSRWTKSIQPGQIYLQWCEPISVDGDVHNNSSESSSSSEDVLVGEKGNTCDESDLSCGVKRGQDNKHSSSNSDGSSSSSSNGKKSHDQRDHSVITHERAFSDACETIWFGSVLGQ